MTLKEIVRRHEGFYAIAFVKTRDEETKRSVEYGVLQTCRQPEKLKGLLEYFQLEGFKDLIPIPCFGEDDARADKMPPEAYAAFWRSYLGMKGGT